MKSELPLPAQDLVQTLDEAARDLRVGRGTVRRLVRDGELDVVRIGRCVRVPKDATRALIDRLRTGGIRS